MADNNHEAVMRAIWELADKQTGLSIRALLLPGVETGYSQDIHEANMAWRALALQLGGISQDEYNTFVLRLKDVEGV